MPNSKHTPDAYWGEIEDGSRQMIDLCLSDGRKVMVTAAECGRALGLIGLKEQASALAGIPDPAAFVAQYHAMREALHSMLAFLECAKTSGLKPRSDYSQFATEEFTMRRALDSLSPKGGV